MIETDIVTPVKHLLLTREKPICHENYVGKRVKRGLFRSATGKVINADINGSLQI
ncbi:MAG: hypothetical protein F6K40_17540 [Okeania sp. SIO3I5]|uniref:hypothetical protein n=1 Tax=Okeania sp. SIO3I5 TaxID=2607805 RepID=UPI0013BE3993|nr:hypothetical protein [Okeania sp. SIO3I5]NEQ37969.1 hypothetical protein [Okeania sp. SIO3I5]